MYVSRITTNYLNNSIISNINNNRDILLGMQEQFISGNKVNKPSDNPGAAAGIMNTNTYLSKMETYLSNVKGAYEEASASDSVLDSIITKLQRAKDLATQGSQELNQSEQLQMLGAEIEEIMKSVAQLANTQYNSKYIYSGINTKTAAYSTADGEYIYQGETSTAEKDQRFIQIDDNMNISVSPLGKDLFGEYYTDPDNPDNKIATGALGDLGILRDAMMAEPPDYETVRESINKLEDDVQHILTYRTELGNTMQTLTMMENKYEDLKISYTNQKSNLQDVDLVGLSSDLTYQQMVLQASLSVGQQMMQPSLLNYM